jgi:hypothetical protein
MQATASTVHITSAGASGYTVKMKHTDLITDKNAGYVESAGDCCCCANTDFDLLQRRRSKVKMKVDQFSWFRKIFLNKPNIFIKGNVNSYQKRLLC